jgi:succinyl-diaminopimelate desuccinylase
MAHLDLSADVVTLTEQLVNTFSVSHHEQEIADAAEVSVEVTKA